ncbi:hypothetical protein CVT24_003191 [Panaeolus cyanescens]|uniref:Uncharacterized protein n=1 Tax=Panaeolus cyanescens TaxID=181874 RepID=A0A409YR75_9AGAR|nr:hypothetical protein CVT24_003191 [Panaeolus cyanescens]
MAQQNDGDRPPTPPPSGPPAPPPPPPPPPRKTHKNALTIQALKNYPLETRLSKNKEIEKKNLQRITYAAERPAALEENPADPAYQDPPSPTAALITITDEDIDEIIELNLVDDYKKQGIMPSSTLKRIMVKTKSNAEPKRKAEKSNDDTSGPDKLTKRQCMDGSRITFRLPGDPTPINFPEIMFVTENRINIPIEFFTRNRINHISAHFAGGLPLAKGTLLSNETGRHPNIIDITSLQDKLKAPPGSLTYAQFLEAKENMIKFQQQRDTGDGSWGALYREHFDFFTSQDNAETYYDSWKSMEVEMRFSWRANETRFPQSVYVSKWISMVDTHGLRIQLQAALGNTAEPGNSDSKRGARGKAQNTNSTTIPPPLAENSITGKKASRSTRTPNSSPHSTKKYASPGTYTEKGSHATTATPEYTSARTAATQDTTHSRANVVPSLEDFINSSKPDVLSYPNLYQSVVHRPAFDPRTHINPDLFQKIVTPYNADAFEHFLAKHNLTDSYPLLVFNLRHGFPLGRMPNLPETVIIKNHLSVSLYPEEVDAYVEGEIKSGRMSGPFTKSEVEATLRGPFQSSPLIVAVQPQGPGVPDKLRVCRHLSKELKHAPSVNSFIEKEDFPTRFDTACRVAEMVSPFPSLFNPLAGSVSHYHSRLSWLHRIMSFAPLMAAPISCHSRLSWLHCIRSFAPSMAAPYHVIRAFYGCTVSCHYAQSGASHYSSDLSYPGRRQPNRTALSLSSRPAQIFYAQ